VANLMLTSEQHAILLNDPKNAEANLLVELKAKAQAMANEAGDLVEIVTPDGKTLEVVVPNGS
jgi:hypothetical protein